MSYFYTDFPLAGLKVVQNWILNLNQIALRYFFEFIHLFDIPTKRNKMTQ